MKPLKIIPTAVERRSGKLRRTPSLRALEVDGALKVVLEGEEILLKPLPGGEFLEARALFSKAPYPCVLRVFPLGAGLAEVRLEKPSPPPRRHEPQEAPTRPESLEDTPPRQEEAQTRRKRVVIECRNEVWTQREVALANPTNAAPAEAPAETPRKEVPPDPVPRRSAKARPPEAAYDLLFAELRTEEFAPEALEGFLEFHGFSPREVWAALRARGLLEESPPFFRLKERARVKIGT